MNRWWSVLSALALLLSVGLLALHPAEAGAVTTMPGHAAVAAAGDWAALTAGGGHTCGVKTDGTAWCWGHNHHGQLGDDTHTQRNAPVRVGMGSSWASLSAGGQHTCGVKTNGTGWCWGLNRRGQLGDDTHTSRSTPVRVGRGSNWASLSAGGSHTCGVRTNGTAWCWGANTNGQLGDDTHKDRRSPVRVGTSRNWASLTAGVVHTCGVKADGSAYCWGDNRYGELGKGDYSPGWRVPFRVGTRKNWATLTAMGYYTCGVKTNGTAWCWGSNTGGTLGIGTKKDGHKKGRRHSPTRVGTGRTWAGLSAGGSHTCGVRTSGTAWCWGSGYAGELGDGTTRGQRNAPVRVGTGSDWAGITAGGSHTCGVRTNGTAWCWGSNYRGELGDGTTTNRSTPVQVK